MWIPQVNWLAVAVSGVVIFILGGVWYSALFKTKWMELMGKTEEELKAASSSSTPALYGLAFVCGLASAFVIAVLLNHFHPVTATRGAALGLLCWIGFAGSTSFTNAIFSMKPKALWAIDTGFNLVSFVLAGVILALWR